MRAPWRSSHDGRWSWTTFWLNLACLITVVRFAVGDSVEYGDLSWTPGEMDAGLPAAILGALGALYYGRRGQEAKNGKATVETVEET